MTGRWVLQNVWHRLVGVRGATNVFPDQCVVSRKPSAPSNFGQPASCEEIAQHRLVFLGEIHSVPAIIAFQREVLAEMTNRKDSKKVHVVLEHFNFEFQSLLDRYCDKELSFDQLVEHYDEHGTEGHDLEPYRELLEDIKRQHGVVELHAGFLPRRYARMLLKDGIEATLQATSHWLPPKPDLTGSQLHYNVFESLLTGRSIYHAMDQTPVDQFRRIFSAQIIKDVAMAHKVNTLIGDGPEPKDDKYLVIAGNGHLLHYCGVPERVLEKHPELANNNDTCLVISERLDDNWNEESKKLPRLLQDRFGTEGSNPADYVFLYKVSQPKEETRQAYDKVGESASLPGNMMKAAWIMNRLGYTQEQFHIAGADAHNFQGVGNPHLLAKIQPGERVLDVGSGLGVDSFVAHQATGPRGQVVGVDLSCKQVEHAQRRAQERGHDNVQFFVADMEKKIPMDDNSVDVIISNGAFCLAPNKEAAFRELFRVLKPGGRISICTTTTKVDNLEPGVSWPLCMQMFLSKVCLEPLVESVGFVDIVVDDSDSSMTMAIPEEVLKSDQNNPARNRVHVGGEEFQHLEKYDMDQLCARVCVFAKKPRSLSLEESK